MTMDKRPRGRPPLPEGRASTQNIRVPIHVWQRIAEFASKHELSMGKAVERLLDLEKLTQLRDKDVRK